MRQGTSPVVAPISGATRSPDEYTEWRSGGANAISEATLWGRYLARRLLHGRVICYTRDSESGKLKPGGSMRHSGRAR